MKTNLAQAKSHTNNTPFHSNPNEKVKEKKQSKRKKNFTPKSKS
jgi:hypothetical protein